MKRKEEIEEQKTQCINALLSSYKEKSTDFISLDTFAKLIGIGRFTSKDEIRLRSVIQLAREDLKSIGFIVANKRNIGYRIAIGTDSLDEKEKQCLRAYKMICGARSKIFNNTFVENDLIYADQHRVDQYKALQEFRSVLFSAIDDLRSAMVKSPFRGKNLAELKSSVDIQIAKDDL